MKTRFKTTPQPEDKQLLMFCSSLEIEVDYTDVSAEVSSAQNPD